MRKAWIIAGTIATTLAVPTVAVATTQAHPQSAGLTRPGFAAIGRIAVVEHADTDTVVDIGPSGDSVGDQLAFSNPIFTADNRTRIGRDNGSCIRTVVGSAWECSWTATLRQGSLAVQGPFYDHGDSVLAITGGTGIWARARGTMHLHARNAKGTAYDFVYHVTR